MSSPLHPKPHSEIRPWYHHLTVDLLIHVLSRSIFHPFIVYIFYLCLASVHKHTKALASYVLYWCGFLLLVASLRWLDHWVTYGKPRKVDWEHEVAVVTGGGSGLGRVLVEMLLRKGAQVAVLDVKEQDGDAVELEDVGLLWCKCNVGNEREVKECFQRVERELGQPTILINNAAAPIQAKSLLQPPPPASSPASDPARTLQTNTVSHIHTMTHFLSSLLRHSLDARGGTVVTISSILGHLHPVNLSTYAASKAAVSSLHHTLTHELRQGNLTDTVKTILVEVGQMDTPLFRDTKLPWYAHFIGPTLEAKDVGKEIVGVLELGQGGVLRMPFYASIVPWYGVMPGMFQMLIRWFSGIDDAIPIDALEGEGKTE